MTRTIRFLYTLLQEKFGEVVPDGTHRIRYDNVMYCVAVRNNRVVDAGI